jgi:glutathione S-transferase
LEVRGESQTRLGVPEDKRNLSHLQELQAELERAVEVLGRILADSRPYLAGGEYSIADMQVYPVVCRGTTYGVITPSDLLSAWLERVAQRPAVRTATQARSLHAAAE